MKWHGKLEEFFTQEARELYNYFLVCFAAIIILLKPVVVVGNSTVSFAFVVVVVDFTDLAVLCYLLITLREKKLWDFSSLIIWKLCGWNETFRTSRGFPPGQILVTC